MKVECISEGHCAHIRLGKVYEVLAEECIPCTNIAGYKITNDIGQEWVYRKERFEIVKEDNNMKKLTFREVIANIKEGEIWESEDKLIGCEPQGIRIKEKDKAGDIEMRFQNETKFTLQRNKVSFQEALESLIEGYEIESVISGFKYKYGDKYIIKTDGKYRFLGNYGDRAELFSLQESLNEWYINK